MKKLTAPGRYSVLLVIVFLATLWFFPMWRIDLKAPQYPGGLTMTIWINDVKDDVDVINGLNHYIGMKTIHKEDFKEFVYLPATIISFIVLGIVVFFWNRKTGYYIWTGIFTAIGLMSFYDFYKWEYDYGHNLDPTAPIQVPGMSYQPPLIGYKKLLNFEVLSQPHVAGWLFILSGVVLVSITFYEWKQSKKNGMKQSGLIVACILLLCGCKPQFEKIDYGKESCSHCKMTIVDKRFAAEMITSKGRTHKFDDVLCMKQYADYYTEQSKDAMYFVAVCNSNSEEFTDATKALYLQHQAFKSPMNGNYGAFSSTESAAATVKELNTQPVSWSDIK